MEAFPLCNAWVVGGIQKLTAVFTLYRVVLNIFSAEGTLFHYHFSGSMLHTLSSHPVSIATVFVLHHSPFVTDSSTAPAHPGNHSGSDEELIIGEEESLGGDVCWSS